MSNQSYQKKYTRASPLVLELNDLELLLAYMEYIGCDFPETMQADFPIKSNITGVRMQMDRLDDLGHLVRTRGAYLFEIFRLIYKRFDERAKDNFYTVMPEDVGKRFLKIGGVTHMLTNSIGYIQEIDIGKRIYVKPYGLSIENNEQRDKRLGKEKK